MRIPLTSALFGLLWLAWAAPAAAQFNIPSPVVPAEDYRVEVGLRLWTPTPEITIAADGSVVAGTDINLISEFGIEKVRFRELRAEVKPSQRHKIRVARVPIRYDADAVIERTLSFSGQTFTVGEPTHAELDWDFWRFGYELDVASGSSGFIGALVDLQYHRIEALISSPRGSATAQARAPVPTVGFIARGYLADSFSLTAEFSGFKVPDWIYDDADASVKDFDVYATLHLGKNLGVQGGYRNMSADYVVDEDRGNLKMKGYYVGGLLRF
ncbi:MAG: hypothetical protein AB7G23_13580 [Vicinamibacterales bacterium]